MACSTPVLLNFDDRMGESCLWRRLRPSRPAELFQSNAVILLVGTLASLTSCRDNGRMWGGAGALCLSWWDGDSVGVPWYSVVIPPTRTSTRPPHPPNPTHCPYRTVDACCCIR